MGSEGSIRRWRIWGGRVNVKEGDNGVWEEEGL